MTAETRNALTVTLPSDREIAMTRVFNASRRLVFEAHSKPEHINFEAVLAMVFVQGLPGALVKQLVKARIAENEALAASKKQKER